MVQGIRADAVYSPNTVRIDQRFRIYFYRCLLGFYRKSCFKTGRDSRPNLNRIGISDKPSALYLDPVQSKRKILGLYVSGSIIFAHSDQRVWATTKTALLMLAFGVPYVLAKLIGKRLERRFNPRETFLSGMQEPLAPDYEI